MIGIYANPFSQEAKAVSVKLIDQLEASGEECVLIDKDFSNSLKLIVVVGGDGTVLDVVEAAAKKDIPILSLNAGSLGFLSCFEADDLSECVQYLLDDKLQYESRPLISCHCEGDRYYALNEVAVQRSSGNGNVGCTVELSLKLDGELADRFRADGLIIATPTGSTAYSLSAGGAILTPGINAMIATPVCAHTLRSKPIVFPGETEAEIILSGRNGGDVFCDGRLCRSISVGCSVLVKKSELSVKLIRGEKSFFNTLFKKLTYWNDN